MEDKLDLLLSKLNKLEETKLEMKETIDAHRVEHGFAKMQDGGVNRQFDLWWTNFMGGQRNVVVIRYARNGEEINSLVWVLP